MLRSISSTLLPNVWSVIVLVVSPAANVSVFVAAKVPLLKSVLAFAVPNPFPVKNRYETLSAPVAGALSVTVKLKVLPSTALAPET